MSAYQSGPQQQTRRIGVWRPDGIQTERWTGSAKKPESSSEKFVVRNYGHTMENEIMQRTMPGARRRGRPRTAWMDNIKTWTGLSMEESI